MTTSFVDYAWWQVTPAQLKSMGFSGAMRYFTPHNTKSATKPEVDNLIAAGLDVGGVFESTANRSTQGFNAGHDDAVGANAFADSLGYPAASTLWYAVDFDASPGQVQAYFDGIGSLAGGRKYAPYGSAAVIDGVHYPGIGWQTAAWSGGRVSSRAGLLQNGFHNTYDSNRVLIADFGQWRSHPVPVPTQKTFHPSGGQEDSTMSLITGPSDDRVDLLVVGYPPPEGDPGYEGPYPPGSGPVYHCFGNTVDELLSVLAWEPLGGLAYSVSGGWTANGHTFFASALGVDGRVWVKTWEPANGWKGWRPQVSGSVLIP